jgi:hypothetical protein
MLLPLLATIGASLSAFADGFRRCPSAVGGGHFPITLNEDGPDCLFTGGVPGGDFKHLLHGL